jgi:hypothetical protein
MLSSVGDQHEASIHDSKRTSRNLFSAVAAGMLSLGCAVDVPVRPAPSQSTLGSSSDSRSCEYLNFDVVYGPAANAGAAASTSDAILREVEAVFSRELESAGFKRVRSGETPWLFLRALLQPSNLRSNAVTGAVQLGATPDLHRDYWSAVSDGSIGEGQIGMSLAVEIGARSGRLDPAATRLREQAREKAHRVWETSAPVLFALCRWREQLVADGLSVDDLRRELVEEMNRIRSKQRRGEQEKRLKLDVEGEL